MISIGKLTSVEQAVRYLREAVRSSNSSTTPLAASCQDAGPGPVRKCWV